MLFRFLITIGSLLGFVTGGLDLLERFGVPVNQWLSGLPDIITDLFYRFGFIVDDTAAAVFGEPEITFRSRSTGGDDGMVSTASPMLDSPALETLFISGGFTLLMLIILLMASRRGNR